MKLIKSLFVVAITVLAFNTTAQVERKSADRAQKSEKLAQELSLTDEQKEQVDAAFKEMMTKTKAVKSNSSLSEEEKRAELKEIKKAHKESLESILTEDQMKKLEELKSERKENVKSPEMQAKRETERMVKELDLSESQELQVAELNLKVAQKIEAIKKDDTMDPKQKREFIKGNMDDKRKTLSTILSEDQLEKYDEMMAERKKHVKEKIQQRRKN